LLHERNFFSALALLKGLQLAKRLPKTYEKFGRYSNEAFYRNCYKTGPSLAFLYYHTYRPNHQMLTAELVHLYSDWRAAKFEDDLSTLELANLHERERERKFELANLVGRGCGMIYTAAGWLRECCRPFTQCSRRREENIEFDGMNSTVNLSGSWDV
jgi:hypothetical protein